MSFLELRNIRKAYRTPDGSLRPVVDVPYFRLDAGSQLALAGPSGTGKTTLLHLIAGILAPDSGEILFETQDLVKLGETARDQWRAESVGYVFQTFNLLQGFTCLENVLLGMTFGRGADRTRAVQLLQRVGLGDRLQDFPRQLSTGQQQRVAVARAVANQPKLVLADEPTGNLDPANAREALSLIRSTCTDIGAALLIVSHDPVILGSFDKVQSLTELNRASIRSTLSNP